EPPPVRPAGRRGPKPKKGPRQAKLAEWARRRDTPWAEVEVEGYGGRRKGMRLFSRTGLWYSRGQDPLAIRYVLARGPAGLLAAEETAWYEKEGPTFSDCLRLVRERIWRARIARGSAERADTLELPRDLVDAVVHGLTSAA